MASESSERVPSSAHCGRPLAPELVEGRGEYVSDLGVQGASKPHLLERNGPPFTPEKVWKKAAATRA